MLKVVNVTNARGDQYDFGRSIRFLEGPDFSGLSVDDVRDFYFKIQVRRGNMDDAAMQALRTKLYAVFNPNFNPVRLELLADDGKEYYIDAMLLTAPVMPPNKENTNVAGVKVLLQFQSERGSLLYEKQAQRTEIALWEEMLEFDASEIVDDEFEFDVKSQSLFKNVPNAGHEYAGIKIIFSATQVVYKPKLLNVNTYEHITLNTTLLAGDTIEVISTRKRISVTLIRNGVQSSAFSKLTLDSALMLLAPGDNIFRYDAESGLDFLEVTLIHHNHWIGV